MSTLPPRLRKLDKALRDIDGQVMPLSQVDALIAGVIVCPELILPREWLPLIWRSDSADGAIFDDIQHARRVTAMVMEHYNAVSDALMPRGRYGPIFDVDGRHDDVLWEVWMEGFDAAMNLRPESWVELIESDDEGAVTAISGMIGLAGISRGDSQLSGEPRDAIIAAAPDLIPDWVRTLNRWRLDHHGAPAATTPAAGAKVGRNEPCPCGSGKKYKKCCLLN